MHWYLVHTKPRQEKCALQHLQQQGYECYLPMLVVEKLRHGSLVMVNEALFPRYLFINLGANHSAKSWAPIRSTKGVSRLVTFGTEPTKVDDRLIQSLRAQESLAERKPTPLFKSGDRVRLTESPFAGMEAIYQMADGESRVIVLVELLSKPVAMRISPAHLRQAG